METMQTTSLSRSIIQIYQKRLLLPIVYLLFLAILWFQTPISELVFPHQVSSEVPFRKLSTNHVSYISTTLTDLHFTGYTQKILGYTNGYYYYTFQDGQCIFVLLAPATCEEGRPDIEQLRVRVRVIQHFEEYHTLTQYLAKDLDWTAAGIRSLVPDYLLSEPGFHKLLSFLLLGIYFSSGAYALIHMIIYAVYIRFPALSPTCRRLELYGNAKKLLAQAEQEFSSLPQLAAEHIYITDNYLIALTNHQAAIVPIRNIQQIYKRLVLHKFLWYHTSVSYTLHIVAKKHLDIPCPKMAEADIDHIVTILNKGSSKTDF